MSSLKLFGKTIPLPLNNHHQRLSDSVDYSSSRSKKAVSEMEPGERELNRDLFEEDATDNQRIGDSKDAATTCSGVSENLKSSSLETETSSPKCSKNTDQTETSTSQQRAMKKPDRIIACPRCNSMETKFCYYNNYNVNQPRHFCKHCQRYWTAGGLMRNVPFGAGRRKNKSSCVPEALRAPHVNAMNEAYHTATGSDSTVLSFGSNFSFYPLPNYWSCNVPSPWTFTVQRHIFPMSTPLGPCMQSSSLASLLRKRSREGEIINPGNPEESSRERNIVQVPSSMTIDDPSEAAKSSIWTTLGIRNKNSSLVNEGSLFMGYQKKTDDRSYIAEASTILQANPAALLRSINFHERSS